MRLHCGKHIGVGMADIADHGPGGAIKITLAGLIPHVNTFGTIKRRAVGTVLIEKITATQFDPAFECEPVKGVNRSTISG